MEPFIYQHMSAVPFFSLISWKLEFPGLQAGFSARHSYDDDQHYNYALYVSEEKEKVIATRRQLVEQLGFSLDSWTCGEQVHQARIAEVKLADRGRGAWDQESAFPATDGLLCREKEVFLASFYADCVPLLFFSPETGYMGVAHAGWRGTVQQIGVKMIEELKRRGAQVENIRVAIGPSIGMCCYEVDQRVQEAVRQLFPRSMWQHFMKPVDQEHCQLDLKRVNYELIKNAGVQPEHIFLSKWCTSCNPTYFYSHRRDRGHTGRMVAWIARK
jgi:YfiH family protein